MKSFRRWFRRMAVVVSASTTDPIGEARLGAQQQMSRVGLRPGKPKFVQFEQHFDQTYVKFHFRAYPTLRGGESA